MFNYPVHNAGLNLKKMNYLILKRILAGVLLGAALFFAPFFVLKVFAFLCILWLFFGLFRSRRHYRYRWAMVNPDHIRNMSEEEYQQYKNNYNTRCCGERHRRTNSKNQE